MNVRAVLFDIYATLLEIGPPLPDAETRWQRLLHDLPGAGPRLTRLDFSVACNRVVARLHEAARVQGIPWPEVQWTSVVSEVLPGLKQLSPSQRDDFIFAQIQTGHTTRLTSETAGLLRWLREHGLLLGIISNAQAYSRRELELALAVHGLELSLFEPALCFLSFEHGFSKPDPHVFRILTARLEARGIGPAETLMVGDRLDHDLEPARPCGWQTWHRASPADPAWAGLRRWLDPPQNLLTS